MPRRTKLAKQLAAEAKARNPQPWHAKLVGKHRAYTRTGKWKKVFIAKLREIGIVVRAREAANISVKALYDARRRDKEFAREWDEALEDSTQALEAEAFRRAYHGVDEPVFFQGQLAGDWYNRDGQIVPKGTPDAVFVPHTIKKHSDILMMFLLKARRPNVYRDNYKVQIQGGTVKHEHTVQVALNKAMRDPGLLQKMQELASEIGLEDLDAPHPDDDGSGRSPPHLLPEPPTHANHARHVESRVVEAVPEDDQ